MKSFRNRIEMLRTELIRSIVGILTENNLEELELSYEQADHIYVIWFNDDGDPYECVARKVVRQSESITVVASSDEVDGELEIDSNYELGARNLDWLCDIYENLMITIRAKHRRNNRKI